MRQKRQLQFIGMTYGLTDGLDNEMGLTEGYQAAGSVIIHVMGAYYALQLSLALEEETLICTQVEESSTGCYFKHLFREGG